MAKAAAKESNRDQGIPKVVTDRLRLRAWRNEDLEELASIQADAETMRYIGEGRAATREEAAAAMRGFQEEWGRLGHGRWAVEERGSGKLIGDLGFVRLGEGEPVELPELAYMLGRHAWGRGLATEGARAALEWAFAALRWDEVVAVTHPENAASQRVLAKLGFVADGMFAGRYYPMTKFRLSLAVFRGGR